MSHTHRFSNKMWWMFLHYIHVDFLLTFAIIARWIVWTMFSPIIFGWIITKSHFCLYWSKCFGVMTKTVWVLILFSLSQFDSPYGYCSALMTDMNCGMSDQISFSNLVRCEALRKLLWMLNERIIQNVGNV